MHVVYQDYASDDVIYRRGTIADVTGVNDLIAEQVHVSPNPTSGHIQISGLPNIDAEKIVSTIGLKAAKKMTVNIKMEHKPGYIFDVTMTESNHKGTALLPSIDSARIEVYNNTNRKEELVLLDHPSSVFNFFFEKGNHYTIMIRKKGYFNKRIEAYVDVDNCILCFDGLSMNGVSEIMTDGNKMGTFLANIEMEPIEVNKT